MVRLAFAIAVFALTGIAQAHHSRSMFDLQNPVQVTGTVREFQWTNPHCYIQLLVRNAAGRDEEWSIEMGAPMHLFGRGWTPRTLKPGDRVTVRLAPLRNGRNGGELLTVTTADGKPLGRAS